MIADVDLQGQWKVVTSMCPGRTNQKNGLKAHEDDVVA